MTGCEEMEQKNTQKKWPGLEEADGLSTREKLEKLVQQNLKRKGLAAVKVRAQAPCAAREPFLVKDFYYSLDGRYGQGAAG